MREDYDALGVTTQKNFSASSSAAANIPKNSSSEIEPLLAVEAEAAAAAIVVNNGRRSYSAGGVENVVNIVLAETICFAAVRKNDKKSTRGGLFAKSRMSL